jgi:hypothetical protein
MDGTFADGGMGSHVRFGEARENTTGFLEQI